MERRNFLKTSSYKLMGLGLGSVFLSSCSDLLSEQEALALKGEIPPGGLPFKISLAQWSLNTRFWSGELDNLDFAQVAKERFGIEAIEYVNQFFFDKATDSAYLAQMNQRASDQGVKNLLIMVDMEGNLGSLDEKSRLEAVDNHYKWIDAAKVLNCHSIRVNAAGKGERKAVAAAAVDSLGRLSEYGAKEQINVVVENHGGYSSDGSWLAGVMKQVNNPYCGTLPDFGNFVISLFPPRFYDPLQGLRELMPFAKGISAKTHQFNAAGQENSLDFPAMIKILDEFNYQGYVGIEYEGYKVSKEAGIMATKELLIQSALAL